MILQTFLEYAVTLESNYDCVRYGPLEMHVACLSSACCARAEKLQTALDGGGLRVPMGPKQAPKRPQNVPNTIPSYSTTQGLICHSLSNSLIEGGSAEWAKPS
jgi:hypothetical protein